MSNRAEPGELLLLADGTRTTMRDDRARKNLDRPPETLQTTGRLVE
jgi:hypothetical protein